MKIIALIPVKNEAWILKTCLTSIKSIVDEIVVLDDGSTDDSVAIVNSFGGEVVTFKAGNEQHVDMSLRRQRLLEEGRRRGGTHFIWLDADEAFSANFLPEARRIIGELAPGQKLFLKWVPLWKSVDQFRSNGAFSNIFKDFVVGDSPELSFEKKFLSEGRTPGLNDQVVRLEEVRGVVLHFQFVAWNRFQLKQAWYRCSELVEGSRGAKRINNTYSITMEEASIALASTPAEWLINLPRPIDSDPSDWYFEAIIEMFERYGVEFFEPLQIWHVKELHDEFVKKANREPVSKTFSPWLISINNFKNKFKNGFKS